MEGITPVTALPPVEEILAGHPLDESIHRVAEHRSAAKKILSGKDRRKLAIVGPCSVSSAEEIREYAERLAVLQYDVRDQLMLVLRVYTQKPRTTTGWTGIMNEPDPSSGSKDLEGGIRLSRSIMHDVGQLLPIADEMLYPENAPYVADLLSYIAVGARSTEDQIHRQVASGMRMPVGIKNTTSGGKKSIELGANGVVTAQASHEFPYRGMHVRTKGNPHAHLVLRGTNEGPNYDPKSIADAHKTLTSLAQQGKITNPAVIVDASHDNSQNGSGKDPTLQLEVVHSLVRNLRANRKEYGIVAGFMLESNLVAGNQKIGGAHVYGQSITDPCLGWDETEELIRETAALLASSSARS